MPINYPGPSLGMSYVRHSPSSVASTSFSQHRRTTSSSLVHAETIHESSSEDEHVDQHYSPNHRTARDRQTAFDTFGPGSPISQSSLNSRFASPSSKYQVSGLGISDTRRPHYQRRSLPPSASTSPMQTLSPSMAGPSSSSSFSPSSPAMRGFRRRSSGNHSPFAGAAGNPLSASPGSPSPSLFSSSFVGSYEQSLLSGRMANKPSNAATPLPFTASVGVLGLGKNTPRALKCPDHVNIPFGAYFWDMDSPDKKGKGSPYVGTLDLTEHYMSLLEKEPSEAAVDLQTETKSGESSKATAIPRFPGYRIPPKGQIQVVIKNANQTAVKLFLVPYDLTDMPPGTKTFIRQKSYDIDPNGTAPTTSTSGNLSPELPSNATNKVKETLRYAIHLQFCAVPAKEKDRGRRKASHAQGQSHTHVHAGTRRPPGLHHGHHLHQPYQHQPPHHQSSIHPNDQRTLSPRRQRDSGASPARPASPHLEHHQQRLRRPRSDTSTASHIYLYKSIRVAFTSRALDLSEKLKTVHEGPSGLQAAPSSKDAPASNTDGPLDKDKYSSYTGPGEEWEEARRARVEADKAHERHLAEMEKLRLLQFEDPVPFDPNGEMITHSVNNAGVIYPPSGAATSIRQGFALLNTPPVAASLRSMETDVTNRGRSSTLGSDILMESAYVPEPLIFQRSPVGKNVPLPSLMESGLSISRPGSRSRNRTSSPEKTSFANLPTKEALR